MNSNKIESYSVDILSLHLLKSDYLDPNISSNDKNPSRDGSITVYRPSISVSKNRSIEDIQGIVPIQVKGKEVVSLNKIKKRFQIKISHLQNYYNNGGTIFFVVFMTADNKQNKIFYNDLLPVKLESILETKNKKYINIDLKEFPNDKIEMTNIFYKFILNSKMQHSFINGNILTLDYYKSQKDYKGIELHFHGIGLKNNFNYLYDDEIYPYVIMKNTPLPVPIKNIIKRAEPIITNDIKISVNGIVFYDTIDVILSENNYTVNIGNSTKLYIDNNESVTLKFERTVYLRELITDLDFILQVIEHRGFYIDNYYYEIDKKNNLIGDFDYNLEKERLVHLNGYLELLDKFNIKEDINLSKLTHSDIYNLEILVSTLINNNKVKSDSTHQIFTQILKVSTLKFYVLLIKHGENYKMYDYFDIVYDNFIINDYKTSQFMILSSEELSVLSDINYDNIKKSFENIENDDIKYRDASTFLLTALKAYDISKNLLYKENLLNFALHFSKWILEKNPNSQNTTNHKLNYYQTLKRADLLTPEQNQDLIEMGIESDEIIVKFATNVLLDREEDAIFYLNKLDSDKQQFILSLPISNLLNNNYIVDKFS